MNSLADSSLLGRLYRHRRLLPFASDLALWAVSLGASAVLHVASTSGQSVWAVVAAVLAAMATHAAVGFGTGLYRNRWRVASFHEVYYLTVAWSAGAVAAILANSIVGNAVAASVPMVWIVTGALVALLGMGATRGVWRVQWETRQRPHHDRARRTLVIGAGVASQQIVRAMLLDPKSTLLPVAILDDDQSKRNRQINGVNVVGTTHDLDAVASRFDAAVVLIAVTDAPPTFIHDLSERAAALNLQVLVLPPTAELVGNLTVADVRPPTVDELLGRPPVPIDVASVAEYLRGKRVLITGAGGSIGSELAKQVRQFDPAALYLLDRDENALHAVQLEMEGRALLNSEMLVVADIRDRARLLELFTQHQPDVVFHAAALKHLTLLERHPGEGVKTNLFGTENVLMAAQEVEVECFVNISTDKAADPTSILGATKLAAERATARVARGSGSRFVSVRFGNVLGSRGSVLPTFLTQLEKGLPLTVTDPDVTRYFMTIPEAVRLVIQAGAIGQPGEVMVLDMGEPVRILDLAHQLIRLLRPGTKIEFSGLRPGEKLHEALFGNDEIGVSRQHPRIRHSIVEDDGYPELLYSRGLLARPESPVPPTDSGYPSGKEHLPITGA